MHGSNGISTAIYAYFLVGLHDYITVDTARRVDQLWNKKEASVEWQFRRAILIRHNFICRAVSASSLVARPQNMGIAVGISLLSWIQAEMSIMPYLLPVNGRHLWFPAHLHIGQYLQYCLVVLPDPENPGIAVGISLLSYVQAKINVFEV